MVKQVGGGSVINGAYPVWFNQGLKFWLDYHYLKEVFIFKSPTNSFTNIYQQSTSKSKGNTWRINFDRKHKKLDGVGPVDNRPSTD